MNLKTLQKSLSFIIVLYSFVHFLSILYIHKVFTCNVFKMWKYVSAKIETIYVVIFCIQIIPIKTCRTCITNLQIKKKLKPQNTTSISTL